MKTEMAVKIQVNSAAETVTDINVASLRYGSGVESGDALSCGCGVCDR